MEFFFLDVCLLFIDISRCNIICYVCNGSSYNMYVMILPKHDTWFHFVFGFVSSRFVWSGRNLSDCQIDGWIFSILMFHPWDRVPPPPIWKVHTPMIIPLKWGKLVSFLNYYFRLRTESCPSSPQSFLPLLYSIWKHHLFYWEKYYIWYLWHEMKNSCRLFVIFYTF